MDLLTSGSWQAIAVAAFAVLAVQLLVPGTRNAAVAIGLRLVAAVLTVVAVAAALDLIDDAQSDAERRVLQARANEIAARALIPGSPLGCLDGQAGETVENACEKSIFAKPETAAAAVAYTEARLALLADSLDFAGEDAAFDTVIAGLRRSIELDRYGLAAQVLSTRDGCTADQCPAFALVQDSATLRANLKARAYDTYVARYATGWGKQEAAPAVSETTPQAAKPEEPAQAQATPGAATPFSSRYDFPSAASIPPVSIMNAEPPRAQAEPGAAGAEAETPLPPRRPQTQGATSR